MLGDFETDRYKTENLDERKTVDRFTLVLAAALPEHAQALAQGRIVAESQNFARDLVAEPSNRLTPSILADRAREMATACVKEPRAAAGSPAASCRSPSWSKLPAR